MKITSLQHYQEVMGKRKVRVERNTFSDGEKKNALMGKVLEVYQEEYNDQTIHLWDENRKGSRWFNKSDVTEMFPFQDYRFGFGDKVKAEGYGDDEFTVIENIIYGSGLTLLCAKNGDMRYIFFFSENVNLTLTPISAPTETIEIGGQKYSKQDVEERLKDLKPIN